MGALTKCILLLFFIDMSLYLFSGYIGAENVLVFEDDLFRKTVDPVNLSQGAIIDQANEQTLTREEGSGDVTIFNIFDTLKNGFTFVTNIFKTIINVFGSPFVLMTSLSNLGTPKPVVIIIFSTIAMLLVLGFIALFRGNNP